MLLTPAMIAQIAQWITVAVSAAEDIVPVIREAIAFIGGLFGAGLITKETQDLLMQHVDDVTMAFIKGTPPPQWTVEPDPV